MNFTRKALLTSLFTALPLGVVAAAKPKGGANQRHAGMMIEMFTRMEVNKDETVTQKGIHGYRKTWFGNGDTNGDGTLSTVEINAMLATFRADHLKRQLVRMDTDGNGKAEAGFGGAGCIILAAMTTAPSRELKSSKPAKAVAPTVKNRCQATAIAAITDRTAGMYNAPGNSANETHLMRSARDEDAELMHRASEGDPTAFRTLSSSHLDRFLGLATWLLGDRTEAEDDAQECSLKVWCHAGRWHEVAPNRL